MKRRPILVSIPQPCNADWNAMTPVQQGRHCAMCQKTVTDFTQMSDGQIIDVYKKSKGTLPCGRYLATQLDRPLVDTRPKVSFAATIAKRAAALLLLVQSASTAMAQQARQDTVTVTQKDSTRQVGEPKVLVKAMAINRDTKLPRADAEIYISEADAHVITDSAGLFNFYVNANVDTVHARVTPHIQIGMAAPAEAIGFITTTDGVKGMVLQVPPQQAFALTAGVMPEIVTFMGPPPLPIVNVVDMSRLNWNAKNLNIFRIKPEFPKLPKMAAGKASAGVWGKLTDYWMGKKRD